MFVFNLHVSVFSILLSPVHNYYISPFFSVLLFALQWFFLLTSLYSLSLSKMVYRV